MMSRLKYTPVCVSPRSRSRVSAFSEPSLLLFLCVFLVRSYDNFYVCEFYKLATFHTFSGVYLLQMYITEGGMLLVFKRCQ